MIDEEKNLQDDEDPDIDDGIYLALTDDEGNETQFELIDRFDFEGSEYVVLLPYEETEDEVVILSVVEGSDEEDDEYVTVDDDDLLNRIFQKFLERDSSGETYQ